MSLREVGLTDRVWSAELVVGCKYLRVFVLRLQLLSAHAGGRRQGGKEAGEGGRHAMIASRGDMAREDPIHRFQ